MSINESLLVVWMICSTQLWRGSRVWLVAIPKCCLAVWGILTGLLCVFQKLTNVSQSKRHSANRSTTKLSRDFPAFISEVCGGRDLSFSFHSSYFEMGDLDDYDFSTGDAGASHIFNQEAGQIRVGG